MDFLPQLASSNNVFLEKAKKHSKRLLKLAKNNNNQLNIHNLSQAQEIVAQLNGYDSWHSMGESVGNKLKNYKPYEHQYIQKNEIITLIKDNNTHLEHSSHYPYFVEKEYMYSFLSLELAPSYSDSISIRSDEVNNAIYRLNYYLKNEKTKSELFILFENKPLSTDLYSWQQQIDLAVHCGLSLKEAQLLFEIEYPTKIKTALSIVIVIKTPLTQKNIHNNLITNIVNFYEPNIRLHVKNTIEQELIEILTKQKTDKYKSTYHYSNNSWIKKIFATQQHIEDIKILEFTTKIANAVPYWAGFLSLETLQFSVFHNQNNIELFDNIYSIVNKQNYYNNDDINLNIGVNESGIPFINSDNNRVNCYQPELDFNPSIFIGNNELRNILNNYIQYISILNRYKQYNILEHGFFIHNGSHNGLYNLLEKTFKNNSTEHIINKKFNINTDFINILDLPLGSSVVDDYDFTVSQLIKICFNLKNINDFQYTEEGKYKIYHLIHNITNELYTLNYNEPKKYTNINEQIHNALPSQLYEQSWFELSHYFIKQNKYHEAQVCHSQAMPTLLDLLNFLKNNYTEYQNEFPNFDINNIVSNIDAFIVDNPHYNQQTNIYFDNTKLYFLDMNYLKSNSILFNCLIKTIFNNNKMRYLFTDNPPSSLLLNISDFDLSVANNIESLILTMRESRKRYINISLNTEAICSELATFIKTQIITSNLSQEQESLLYLKISKSNKPLDYHEFILDSYNNINGIYKLIISEELYDILSNNIKNNI